MAKPEIHRGILKFCLNIYLKILLLSALLDDDCSKYQGLILHDSTQSSFDPKREELIKPCFEKLLKVHGPSDCAHVLLLGWIRAGVLSTAENPSLIKVLKYKLSSSEDPLWCCSSEWKQLSRQWELFPPPALSCHRETHTGNSLERGIFVLSQKSLHRDTLPQHLCPDHCKRHMRDCPRLEDSFLGSKSCSQTWREARGQWAPYLLRTMRGVETQGENPQGMNMKNQRA